MKISDEVKAVIKAATFEDNALKLTGQLDRKLYVEVNKVLEAMGGKWNRKAKGHLFNSDPRLKLETAVEEGEYISAKEEFSFFPTPDELAKQLVAKAHLYNGLKALEPSAGHGAIAALMMDAVGRGNLHTYEILEDNASVLNQKGIPVEVRDFLTVEPTPIYDRIVMNPPFEKQQDITHVMHAWQFLKPGGRLVAVMAAGVEYRQNKKATAFRELVEENGSMERNAPNAFKASKTSVQTVTVILDK